jgi:hypothetical protein
MAMQYLPSGSPARVLMVFAFVLFCPGLAVVKLLPTLGRAERWTLAIALSMSLALLTTVALTVMRNGSVTIPIVALALIVTTAVVVEAVVSS